MRALSKSCLALPLAAVVFSLAAPAAMSQQNGVVNVDLRNARILNNIARNLNVNVSQIPITIQLPISAAANVCQVDVAVLSNAIERGGATCTAQSTSFAVYKVAQHQINHQTQ